ncbi:hypothetical protein SAMN05880501_107167 [Ureibacillus xyleni]|uniref:Uncharacterized protein n=1 Tax=Ureibacillus xyleni TaxID=614648 RepID=A0A285SXF7_9BACL|nr:hypothetical protein [Ureibacillus xyleni]SOC13364.1 hypothetical protein SAMN05880501_107167 [Ureibacillus xyleni]
MKKIIPLLFIFVIANGETHANADNAPQPFEVIFPEVGYKTVEAALWEFEKHFQQELKLPLRVPPISFTHHFGRFSDLDGEINDSFEMKMISDQYPENHFKIDVRPVKYNIPFDRYVSKVYQLTDGKKATYIEDPRFGFNMLVFEKEGWQYVFSIDNEAAHKVTPEILVQIANSIDY